MKIAILSDIHGNLPALEAVTADIESWQPDMTIVNGDIVNGGPCNRACWQFVQEQQRTADWHLLRGNHVSLFLLAMGQSSKSIEDDLNSIKI